MNTTAQEVKPVAIKKKKLKYCCCAAKVTNDKAMNEEMEQRQIKCKTEGKMLR
jgi:hypothetical protein